jgi:hypothetical protein
VRGATLTLPRDDFHELVHEFDAATARLQLENVPGRGFELHVGLSRGDRPVEARVTLSLGGRAIDSAATEAGTCTFAGLEAGRYLVEIGAGAARIGAVHVDVLA